MVTFGAQVGRQVEFSPDGRWLAVSWTPDSGQALELLSVPTLEPAPTLRGLPGRGWQVTDLSFSGDASHFAAGLQRTADVECAPRSAARRSCGTSTAGPRPAASGSSARSSRRSRSTSAARSSSRPTP